MRHDMIVQLRTPATWPARDELELRYKVEEDLEEALGSHGDVDGGDSGSGSMNIFIVQVDDPTTALLRIKTVLERHGLLGAAIVNLTSFENEDDEDSVVNQVVWPENFKGRFSVF